MNEQDRDAPASSSVNGKEKCLEAQVVTRTVMKWASMNPFKSPWKPLVCLMGLVGSVCVAGCGGGGGGDSGSGGMQMGTVSVSMTDSPACGFDQVNVTVSKVRIHQSATASDTDPGWTEITLNPPRKINLLDLNDPTQPNFALETLGLTPLAAGHYTQLRLVLVPNSNNPNAPLANSVVLSGTATEIALDTPSGIQSGIKLIHEFDVASGQRVDLLLDFDACKSVVTRGNGTHLLMPVITVIPFVLNGIDGFLDPSLFPNQVNANHVLVSAQQNGQIVRSTMPNAVTGEFFLGHLDPGNYDVVITADGHATAVIAAVPVASSTSITKISSNLAPFTLQASTSQSISGTVTLNPADDTGTVIVVAKQTLNGGPTVTVKSQMAMVLTATPQVGDYGYNLMLPIAAPSLGQFNNMLPVALSAAAQSAVAGVYTVQTSGQTLTTVYATQSPAPSAVNISGGSTIENFTLTP